jgi:hypothetical protein
VRLDPLYAELEELAVAANQLDTDTRRPALQTIDKVAEVATARFGEMPPAICGHLAAATQAAISGDVPALVRYVDATLYAIEGPKKNRSGQLRLSVGVPRE